MRSHCLCTGLRMTFFFYHNEVALSVSGVGTDFFYHNEVALSVSGVANDFFLSQWGHIVCVRGCEWLFYRNEVALSVSRVATDFLSQWGRTVCVRGCEWLFLSQWGRIVCVRGCEWLFFIAMRSHCLCNRGFTLHTIVRFLIVVCESFKSITW